MPFPLLYVCVRPQREAADAEYASFREALALPEGRLARHDLVRDPLPPDAFERYAGFVVGGSPFNVTDAETTKSSEQRRLEADLERIAGEAAASRTAALFTCYGIGIVTRMLGGEVSRAHPEDTGPTDITLTAAAGDDALFAGLPPRFAALTAHKEGAAVVPGGGVLLAENDACPVQAYRVGDRLWATQFHPEPTTTAFTARMAIYRNDGYFPPDDFDSLSARVLATEVAEPLRLLSAFGRLSSVAGGAEQA